MESRARFRRGRTHPCYDSGVPGRILSSRGVPHGRAHSEVVRHPHRSHPHQASGRPRRFDQVGDVRRAGRARRERHLLPADRGEPPHRRGRGHHAGRLRLGLPRGGLRRCDGDQRRRATEPHRPDREHRRREQHGHARADGLLPRGPRSRGRSGEALRRVGAGRAWVPIDGTYDLGRARWSPRRSSSPATSSVSA